MTDTFSIAHVEQTTGIPKELLRMWERRYGFPQPARDAQGDRIYTPDDITKLGLVRQLMEQGKRPGKLVNQSIEALQQLCAQGMAIEANRVNELIPMLKNADFYAVREWLESRLHSQGIQRFVCETLPRLNKRVGTAWENGELDVHEEHFYTEQIKNLLRASIATLAPAHPDAPCAVLTTIPGELHGLGLLMVEVQLRLEGFTVISLGTQTPMTNIVNAARAHHAQVVALSFSSAYRSEEARQHIVELRAMLPASIALWAGGEAVHDEQPIEDVQLMASLQDVQNSARHLKQQFQA
jgi:methanogenic corrinoid protein MtbC1